MSLTSKQMTRPANDRTYVESKWTVGEDGNIIVKAKDGTYHDLGLITDMTWTPMGPAKEGYVKYISLQLESSSKKLLMRPHFFSGVQKDWPTISVRSTVQVYCEQNKRPKKLNKMLAFKGTVMCLMNDMSTCRPFKFVLWIIFRLQFYINIVLMSV